jgi:hypothetical protein
MRDDLKKLAQVAVRNGRAVEWLRGFKRGVLVCPIPKDATEGCNTGYYAGRITAIKQLNSYLVQQGLKPVDEKEGLNLLIQADLT